tara:strand:- start:148 stop:582 length:435 start_codon:yes stop_codon:yes gene_type:complete
MRNIIHITALLFFIPVISFSQTIDQKFELPALRFSENFSKPYRVLNTTITDKSLFQQYYKNTDLTLEHVIRYYFYTSINLNSEQNQLISMDGSKFNLSSKNAKDLTDEIISLIGNMYFGRKEVMEFKKLNKELKQIGATSGESY